MSLAGSTFSLLLFRGGAAAGPVKPAGGDHGAGVSGTAAPGLHLAARPLQRARGSSPAPTRWAEEHEGGGPELGAASALFDLDRRSSCASPATGSSGQTANSIKASELVRAKFPLEGNVSCP